MRPKIAMWSDYGAPPRKHWRSSSRRSRGSSIGPKILVAAVVVVAGVIGISGIYPQVIDSGWVQGSSPRSQRVAYSGPTRAFRRSGVVAEIPLPPRRSPAISGEGVAAIPAATPTPTPAPPSPLPVTSAPIGAAIAQAPAAAPAGVTAPAPSALARVSPPATEEMRRAVGAAAEQPATRPDAALADIPDPRANAAAPVDPPTAAPSAAPAAAARPVYAGRAPVAKRQRVVHDERRSRASGGYAQWDGWGGGWNGWPASGFPYHF